jgi:hypothetical protein
MNESISQYITMKLTENAKINYLGVACPKKYTRGISRGIPSTGSMGISIGVAAMHPGIVIDPWPMSKSTNVGFQPCLAAQLRSILDRVLLPESVGPTTITLGPWTTQK